MLLKVIDRAFSPLVEPFLNKLEKNVSLEDHNNNCLHFFKKLNRFIDKNLEEREANSIPDILKYILIILIRNKNSLKDNPKKFNLLIDSELDSLINNGKGLSNILFEFSSLQSFSKIFSTNINNDVIKKLPELINNNLHKVDWLGSEEERQKAKELSQAYFFGLTNNLLTKEDSSLVSSYLQEVLPHQNVITSSGVIYGSSFFLRSLLISKTENDIYLKEVTERILRRMEIKREKIFNFVSQDISKDDLILEQIRLILFVLEVSSKFKDLRFLNAALKANDRLESYFRRLKLSNKVCKKNIKNVILALHYLESINFQEKQMDKVA